MTHSVAPNRHGILTNTYVPQVRPIAGIFEKINNAGGVSAMFYGWEPLRDIASPGSLKFSTYVNAYTRESADTVLTDKCLELLETDQPDFVFLYMVDTDEKGGHDSGWMTDEYLRRVSIAIDNVKRVFEKFEDKYSIVIMADHGGHERSHGSLMDEDMIIPFFFYGKDFQPGEISQSVSLLEIAPTIVKILDIEPDPDWEGNAIF
jgi:phosphopentomutase